jgi:Ca2+/Na+ antiporter
MDITSLLLEKQTTYIKGLQFRTFVLLVLTGFFLTITYPKTYGFVILLILFLYVIGNEYIRYSYKQTDEQNKTIHHRLLQLQRIIDQYIVDETRKKRSKISRKTVLEKYRLHSLYTDSDIINFLYDIRYFADRNPHEFYLLVKGTNNILFIKKQIEDYYTSNGRYQENMIELVEVAEDLRSRCTNNIHNFIFTVHKSNKFYKYHETVTERYMLLLRRHFDRLYDYVKIHQYNTGTNTNSKLHIYNMGNATKPLDPMINPFDFY